MGLRHYVCLIFILWICSLSSTVAQDYGGKITHAVGALTPRGDILLEYGKDVINSTCTITNPSILVTKKNRFTFTLGKKVIDDSLVERLDNRSARVVILKPEITKPSTYLSCDLDGKNVDINYLVVGTKPQDIQGFKCRGYNYENMTCSWKRELTTNYNVNYTISYRFKNRDIFTCDMIETVDTMSCFWNMSTRPQLRPAQNDVYFTITGTNIMGSITKEFHIEQQEIMISDAPINLSVIRVKPRMMVLSWELPVDVTLLPGKSVQYRVMVTCEYWNMTSFKQVAVFRGNNTDRYIKYNLTDLPYANTLYDIRVGIKLSKYNLEEMWSANSSVTNYTASIVPASAPRASRTGFYFPADDGVLTIYWTQLDKRLRNGQNFEYIITPFENGANVSLPVLSRSNAHIQYENISYSASYKFKIESKNSQGKSKNASYVVVPPKKRITLRMAEPVQTEYSDMLHQLSWEPPIHDAHLLTNYTVYWCVAQKESASHLCEGTFKFETVPKTTLKYNVTIEKNTNVWLAVSANGERQSSGMVWAACRIHHTNVQHKIKKIWVEHVSNTSITLRWEVRCVHKTGNIKGYFVEYCRTNSTGLECVAEDMKNRTLQGANHEFVTIGGLEPYSSYQLRVYTMDGVGSYSEGSEWVANTTYDGTPTAPYGLNITSTSNTTINLEWFAPLKKNGIISSYKIYYNDEQDIMKINVDTTQVVAEKNYYNLTNLSSYQLYNVSVAACVREMCSNRSNFVTGWTHVGAPGQISEFTFNPENKTISWPPPNVKGGKIDYYQVKLRRNNEADHQAKIKITNGSYYQLRECEEGRIFYQVRAVNLLGNDEFYGAWSREESENCHIKTKAISAALIVPLAIIFVVILLGLSFAMWKFLLKYVRRMKDVQYELPNNMQPPSTDPHFLLDHKELDLEPQQNGSSGFNSAQESSSESGESMSSRTTDSGTVQHREDCDNSFPLKHLNDVEAYRPISKSSSGGNYVTVFDVKGSEEETRNGILSNNPSDESVPSIKMPVNPGYTPVEPTPSYVMAMPPGGENKEYVPTADFNKFMEPIVLPPFRFDMSVPSTTFMNDRSNDKGYVHATFNGDMSNFNAPNKDTPPQGGTVFKVSPGYVSCADSAGHPVPAEPTSSAYVMHKQLEQMVPNN